MLDIKNVANKVINNRCHSNLMLDIKNVANKVMHFPYYHGG